MRWPWQRDDPRDTATSTPVDGPGAAVQRAAATSPMGWAFLPPLQRSIAAPELITRPAQFPHTLPAWRDPTFSSHDLGHVVSPAAPSGVIDGDGTGTPVQRAAHPDLPLLLAPPPAPAVQRSAVDAPVAAPAPPVPRSYTRTATEHLPVLQLVAVEPAPEPAPEAQEEPSPDEAPAGASATREPNARSGAHDGGASGQPPPVPGFEARSARTSTSEAPTLGASEVSMAAVQRSSDPASAATPPSPRRRYGLGAPLASVPSSSTPVQRQVEPSGPSSTPDPTPPVVAAPTLPAAPPPPDPPTGSTSSGPGTATAPDPAVQRTPDTPASTETIGATSEPAAAEAVGTASASPSVVALEAPPAPDRPTLQRTTAPTTLAPGAAAVPTPVHRAPVGTDLPVVAVRPDVDGPAAPTPTSQTALQRSSPRGEQPVAPAVVATEAVEARTTDDTATSETPLQRDAADAEPAVQPTVQSAAEPAAEPPAAPARVVAAEEPQARATPDLVLAVATPESVDVPVASTSESAQESPGTTHAVDDPTAVAPTSSGSAHAQRSVDTTEPSTTQPLLGGPRSAMALLTPTSTAPTPVGAVGSTSPGSGGTPAATVTVARSATTVPAIAGRTVPSPNRPGSGPGAPTVSRAFGLPSLPSLPSAPAMPATPDLPTGLPSSLPAAPAFPSVPSMPGLPTLPLAPGTVPSGETVTSPTAPLVPTEPVLDPRSSSGATEVPIGGGSGGATGGAATTAAPTGAAAGAAGGPHGGSSDDMEALAQKLLSPMLRRIRAELLLDRERRGLRTDTW